MPMATAMWLIENTALSFRQIANFTALTEIEIEAMADEEIGKGIVGRDPVDHGELTKEELARCEADPSASLQMAKNTLPPLKTRSKGPRYTPISKRGDKPDAIAWLLKHATDISDAQICKLIGTTKPTIAAIRDRTHANIQNLRPRHPAELGLCTYQELDTVHRKALKAAGKDPDAIEAERQRQAEEALSESGSGDSQSGGGEFSNFDFSSFVNSTPDSKDLEDAPSTNPEDYFKKA